MKYEFSHTLEFYQPVGNARILMCADVEMIAWIEADMREERGWSVAYFDVADDSGTHQVPADSELFRQAMERVEIDADEIATEFFSRLEPAQARAFAREVYE